MLKNKITNSFLDQKKREKEKPQNALSRRYHKILTTCAHYCKYIYHFDTCVQTSPFDSFVTVADLVSAGTSSPRAARDAKRVASLSSSTRHYSWGSDTMNMSRIIDLKGSRYFVGFWPTEHTRAINNTFSLSLFLSLSHTPFSLCSNSSLGNVSAQFYWNWFINSRLEFVPFWSDTLR